MMRSNKPEALEIQGWIVNAVLRSLPDSEVCHSKFEGKGQSHVKMVNESGLYKLVLRAQRSNPAARDFQDWIVRDVLPAIRKDGMYVKDEEKVATGELSVAATAAAATSWS